MNAPKLTEALPVCLWCKEEIDPVFGRCRNAAHNLTSEQREAMIGVPVRMRRGVCGEGYRFTIVDVMPGHFGEVQIYGSGNYGPVRLTEIEALTDAGRAALRGES